MILIFYAKTNTANQPNPTMLHTTKLLIEHKLMKLISGAGSEF